MESKRFLIFRGSGDVMVFGGTALALASAGLYLALVHGVSAARLRRGLRPVVGMEPIGNLVKL